MNDAAKLDQKQLKFNSLDRIFSTLLNKKQKCGDIVFDAATEAAKKKKKCMENRRGRKEKLVQFEEKKQEEGLCICLDFKRATK